MAFEGFERAWVAQRAASSPWSDSGAGTPVILGAHSRENHAALSGSPGEEPPRGRPDLLAEEHAAQPDQRDDRRRGCAHVQHAVEGADQHADAQREQVELHARPSGRPRRR